MDQTEHTARHEAAHAVAAHALGLPVLSVDADPGGFPVTRFRSRVVDNWDRAVVSMAGPIAEGRHPAEGVVCEALADLDWQDEEDHDDDLASALAEYPDLTNDQRVNVVMLAWQRAADLLAEHEPAWQRVTAALVQRHQLDGAGFLALAEQKAPTVVEALPFCLRSQQLHVSRKQEDPGRCAQVLPSPRATSPRARPV